MHLTIRNRCIQCQISGYYTWSNFLTKDKQIAAASIIVYYLIRFYISIVGYNLLTRGTQLPEKERFVLQHYFIEGLNLREIGEALKVTESRACQLRKSGIARLQKILVPRAA